MMIRGTCYFFFKKNVSEERELRLCNKGSLCPFKHWTQEECQLYRNHYQNQNQITYDCNKCKGSGMQTILINQDRMEFCCTNCHGKKQFTKTISQKIKSELLEKDFERVWCHCKQFQGTTYFADGKHPRCSKHCYVCNQCKNIVQIG